MTRYVVVVTDEHEELEGPWTYGPFDSAELADEWLAGEQNPEGVVDANKAVIVVLNLP